MSEQRNPFDDIPDLVPDLAPPAPKRAAPVAQHALPPMEAPTTAPSEPPGPIDFGGAFDLDVGGAQKAPAFSAPAPSQPRVDPSLGPAIKEESFALEEPVRPAPQPVRAPQPQHQQQGQQQAQHQPQQHQHQVPPPAPSGSGGSMSPESDIGETAPSAPLITKEQVQEAARKAAVLGREVAGKTREVAFAAAIRSVGGNQAKVIRIEDPSTWLKPMLGPIIALVLALVFTLVAVFASLSIKWLTIPLLLGAIVFGVVRWFRLQADQ